MGQDDEKNEAQEQTSENNDVQSADAVDPELNSMITLGEEESGFKLKDDE